MSKSFSGWVPALVLAVIVIPPIVKIGLDQAKAGDSLILLWIFLVIFAIGWLIIGTGLRHSFDETDEGLPAETKAPYKRPALVPSLRPVGLPPTVNAPSNFLASEPPDAICRCSHKPLQHSDDGRHPCNIDDCTCMEWDRRA